MPLDKRPKTYFYVTNEFHDAVFDVERKYSNDNTFTKVGTVAATNSNGRNSYSFEDRNIDLNQPLAYYRLKQIDLDAHYKYSPQLLIKRNNAGKLIYYVSANNSQLMIRAGNKQGISTIGINIYDLNGRLVLSQQKQYTDQYIDISKLATGAYLVKCRSPQDTEEFVSRFVK